MNVTITGPNPHGGMFHVHRTGCRDLDRQPYRSIPRNIERYEEEHDSVRSIVEECYSDQIAEDPGATWEDYLGEFKFFPCVDDLPQDEVVPRNAAIIAAHKAGENLVEIARRYEITVDAVCAVINTDGAEPPGRTDALTENLRQHRLAGLRTERNSLRARTTQQDRPELERRLQAVETEMVNLGACLEHLVYDADNCPRCGTAAVIPEVRS